MNAIEDALLERGFHESVLKQMNELKHDLLKLDKAAFEQGEDSKRKSDVNSKEYINSSQDKLPAIRHTRLLKRPGKSNSSICPG